MIVEIVLGIIVFFLFVGAFYIAGKLLDELLETDDPWKQLVDTKFYFVLHCSTVTTLQGAQ